MTTAFRPAVDSGEFAKSIHTEPNSTVASVSATRSTIAIDRESNAPFGRGLSDSIVAELRRRGYILIDGEGRGDRQDVDLFVVFGQRRLVPLQQQRWRGIPVISVNASTDVECDATVIVGNAPAAGEVDRIVDEILCWKWLPWDCQFFSRRIATMTQRRITTGVGTFVTKDCFRAGVDCLYFLADCHHQETVATAEANGFHFVDIRVTFEQGLGGLAAASAADSGPVRLAVESDILYLREIALGSYVVSRFFFDGNFTISECEEFYSNWIEKSCLGYASAVLVATDQEVPVGYITCQIQDGSTGAIALVGVSDKSRGRAIGRRLVLAALAWFREQGLKRATVVTQGRNYQAQRLYQRCGFVTAQTELWYHKWFPEKPE